MMAGNTLGMLIIFIISYLVYNFFLFINMVRFARFLIVVTTCGKRKSYGNHIGKRSGMLSVIITKSVLVMT